MASPTLRACDGCGRWGASGDLYAWRSERIGRRIGVGPPRPGETVDATGLYRLKRVPQLHTLCAACLEDLLDGRSLPALDRRRTLRRLAVAGAALLVVWAAEPLLLGTVLVLHRGLFDAGGPAEALDRTFKAWVKVRPAAPD